MCMKKIMNWMLAAIIICGASVFTSCTNDDNPVVEPDLNVAEKIIGKWIVADKNGHPAATNEKVVYNFTSATKAYLSASLNGHPDAATPWYDLIEADVVIEGNKVTLTMHPDEHIMSVHEYVITAINESEFTANLEVTVMKDGNMVLNQKVLFTLTKVKADYSAAILGVWEGQVTSEQDTYGDGLQHRWEFKTDGTYVYYVKDGDNWVASPNTLNEYFVAGKLLCMRWVNAGTEYREWWEIESVENGVMKWSALRKNADGTTYTSTFEMKKVTE